MSIDIDELEGMTRNQLYERIQQLDAERLSIRWASENFTNNTLSFLMKATEAVANTSEAARKHKQLVLSIAPEAGLSDDVVESAMELAKLAAKAMVALSPRPDP